MLVRDKAAFIRGVLLLGGFIVLFIVFFLPIFPAQEEGGGKTNALVYADHLFNSLSKESSNYFDASMKNTESVDYVAASTKGTTVNIRVKFKDEHFMQPAENLLREAGFTTQPDNHALRIVGDLHTLLLAVNADSFSTYHNRLEEVSARHDGMDGRTVMKSWWHLLTGMVQPMQKARQTEQAAAVKLIISRGVEPSYNFYGITPLMVSKHIPLIAGFLIFYVFYTLWYGFGVFELLEGLGLSMKKRA
jgi:hypothetical protein